MLPMTLDPAQLPDDIATLKAMVIAAERKASDRGLEIEALKLTIAKLQRNTFGASSESGKKLLDQLELQLAELEEGMAEDKGNAFLLTQVRQPIPRKHTLDAHDQFLPIGRNDPQKRLGGGGQILVHQLRARLIQDTDVHRLGM